MPRGRPRNEDRLDAIALGLPTYTGKVHPACGTAERYARTNQCVRCSRNKGMEGYYAERDAKLARKQIEAMTAPAREPLSFDGPRPTRFFTGAPCIHGHIAERLISSGGCVKCKSIWDNAKRSTRAYKDQRNATLAAKRAADRAAGKIFGKPGRPSNQEQLVSPPRKKRRHMPMRLWKTRQQEQFRKPVPTTVNVDALAVGRALTKEARTIRHIVNADAYKKRTRRKNEKSMKQRTEAMAVARMMIPDTLKSVKGYGNKVKTALDFVKLIGAQHPPEKNHVPLRHAQDHSDRSAHQEQPECV